MYLFFDGVSSLGYIALLDKDKNIKADHNFQIQGNESTQTIPIIDQFLSAHKISYNDIENIICVAGPGSFTGIRTISLVVNTLAFTYKHILLTPVNFFDLYNDYPIVKSSSKRDLFVKMEESAIIQVIPNNDFENNYSGTSVFGDTNIERFEKNIEVFSKIEYQSVIKNITLGEDKIIAPMYIKKPNIS